MRILTFLTCLLIGTFQFLIFGCSSTPHPYDPIAVREPFINKLQHLSGPNAKNCGIFELGQNPRTAYRCAEETLSSEQPFYLGIQQQGIDSDLWLGYTKTPTGKLWEVFYDSDITGSVGYPEHAKPRLRRKRCATVNFSSLDWVRPYCQEIPE